MNTQEKTSCSEPARILVRGVNWLGDAVMTTPALLRLREKFPAAHIALLTAEKLGDLWLHHPTVNEIISFAPGESVFSVSRKLREKNFDLALVLPNSPRSALEMWLAGIPQRIGYARQWRNFFLTRTIPTRSVHLVMNKLSKDAIQRLLTQKPEARSQKPEAAHQIYEYLHLVAALGASGKILPPRLLVTAEEIESAKTKFALKKIIAPIFGLNPGAEYGPAKRWPVKNFIAAAREIQQRTNCIWILLGGKADAALTSQIASALHASRITHHDLSGQTSLRELMALLKSCRLLLTNDTGPMHLAAALGTPVIVPFGSTSPELTGPGLPGDPRHRLLKSDAPCSPCFLRDCPIDFRCMNGISVDRVVAAVLSAAQLNTEH